MTAQMDRGAPHELVSMEDDMRLLQAFLLGAGPATEEELLTFLDWAQQALVAAGLVRGLLAGDLVVAQRASNEEATDWRFRPSTPAQRRRIVGTPVPSSIEEGVS